MRGSVTEAATDTYNANFCLGGWQNPTMASGESQVAQGSPESAYHLNNSAYLSKNVSAQIFCGYFSVLPREKLPLETKVVFNWHFAGISEEKTKEITEEEQNSASEEQSGSQSASEDSIPSESSAEVPVEDTMSADQDVDGVVSTPEESEPVVEDIKDPVEEESSEPEESLEEVSLLDSVFSSIYAWKLVHRANAEEPTSPNISLGDLLDVSYSFDGVRWHSIGRVSASNWKGYSVSIPAASWEDLKNLQIMLSALPAFADRPDIYLESIELSIDADRTMLEIANDGMALATNAMDSVIGYFIPPPAPQPVAPAVPPAPSAPPAKEKRLVFAFSQDAEETEKKLGDVQIKIERGGQVLSVEGTCTTPYFVVLTYRNEKDYNEKPRSFASNYAGACEGGLFSHDMSHLPTDTKDGTYYLLLGRQGEDGPWEKTTDLLPIEISHIEVSIGS